MKTKNTFSKLRRINNNLKDKLNESIKIARLANEENYRLIKVIDDKNICINSLEIKERELSEKIHSLCDKAVEQNRLNNDNYNAWLDECKTNSKLNIMLTVSFFVICGLVGGLIGVIK